jgi:hypothetical protein
VGKLTRSRVKTLATAGAERTEVRNGGRDRSPRRPNRQLEELSEATKLTQPTDRETALSRNDAVGGKK